MLVWRKTKGAQVSVKDAVEVEPVGEFELKGPGGHLQRTTWSSPYREKLPKRPQTQEVVRLYGASGVASTTTAKRAGRRTGAILKPLRKVSPYFGVFGIFEGVPVAAERPPGLSSIPRGSNWTIFTSST